MVPVEHRVEDVEREPGDGKRHHDCNEHDVDPRGALVLLLRSVPASLHHVLPPLKAQVDVQVADHDQGEGEEVLEDEQGGGVSTPLLNGRPRLHAHEVVADWEGEAQVLEWQCKDAVLEKRHRD